MAHWRDTMRPVRFFMFDARASFPVLFLIMHFRTWTLVLTAVIIIIFAILERKGLTFEVAMRALRAWFVGKRRPKILSSFKRKMIDHG